MPFQIAQFAPELYLQQTAAVCLSGRAIAVRYGLGRRSYGAGGVRIFFLRRKVSAVIISINNCLV